MSDIRLNTLRNPRTRNGYARYDSSRWQQESSATASTTTSANHSSGSHSGGLPMPIITTAAAAAAASSSSSFTSARRKKGRRRNDYGDGEPEEQATLLGEGERDPGFLHDDEELGGVPTGVERVHKAASQVCVRVAIPCPLLLTWRICTF